MLRMRSESDPENVIPLYFQGFQPSGEKVLLDELRIRRADPRNAIMNVSFIGGCIAGVLTSKECKSKTLIELQEARVTYIKDFNIFDDSLKKNQDLRAADRRIRNLNAVLYRTRRCTRLPICSAAKD